MPCMNGLRGSVLHTRSPEHDVLADKRCHRLDNRLVGGNVVERPRASSQTFVPLWRSMLVGVGDCLEKSLTLPRRQDSQRAQIALISELVVHFLADLTAEHFSRRHTG